MKHEICPHCGKAISGLEMTIQYGSSEYRVMGLTMEIFHDGEWHQYTQKIYVPLPWYKRLWRRLTSIRLSK